MKVWGLRNAGLIGRGTRSVVIEAGGSLLTVTVEETPMKNGGAHWHFRCPGCERRAKVLRLLALIDCAIAGAWIYSRRVAIKERFQEQSFPLGGKIWLAGMGVLMFCALIGGVFSDHAAHADLTPPAHATPNSKDSHRHIGKTDTLKLESQNLFITNLCC
jgi:hypothetical protein